MTNPPKIVMMIGEKKKRRRSMWTDATPIIPAPTNDSERDARVDTVPLSSNSSCCQQQQSQRDLLLSEERNRRKNIESCFVTGISQRRFWRRTYTLDVAEGVSSYLVMMVVLLLCTEIHSFTSTPFTHQHNCRSLLLSQPCTKIRIDSTKTIPVLTPTLLLSVRMMMMVQKLEPLTETSEDRRTRAVTAMNRAKVENALLGIDPQTIGRLSSQFLSYPSNQNNNNSHNNGHDATTNRPKIRKGRPESVLGAMTQQTMARYLEHQSAMKVVQSQNGGLPVAPSDLEVMVITPYMIPPKSKKESNNDEKTIIDNFQKESTTTTTYSSSPPTTTMNEDTTKGNFASTTRQRRKLKGVKSTNTITTNKNNGELPTACSSSGTTSRKSVFKNLPKAKQHIIEPQSMDNNAQMTTTTAFRPPFSKTSGVTNGMDIQQYYRTELLTPDEEYALGMKIQFMDKCEQVHEGLASAMHRLPTIEEWANACGFTESESHFIPTEADEQLRPVGSDAMFDDIDPNMFVGNGLAHQTGPGSGRGRAKREPPLGLKDYYDDSEYRRQLKLYLKHRGKDKSIQRPRKTELVRPINRGTPTDFVEMLMTAHEAKQKMVQSNMRLVISIARKYYNAGVSLQDLVQEGSLGLSRAAEKFEPKKGFKFSTYASWWIQQAVFRSIAYHSRTIRLPVHVHNLLNRVRKVRQLLQTELGRVPTNEEIAGQLGMSRQKFNKMLHLTKQSISLETPKYLSNPKDLGHESDDLLGETLSKTSFVEDEATPQKAVDHGLFHEDLKNIMKILDENEHRVICARYGLHDGLTRTVTTVAAQMKQSKAWVRSQECRALRKLRRPWYEKKLKEHQDALAG